MPADIRELTREVRGTPLDEVTDEQIGLLNEAASQAHLSPRERGYVNRTLLLPQILRIKHPSSESWRHLIRLCDLFRDTTGYVTANPDERALVAAFAAKAHFAAAMSQSVSDAERQASAKAGAEYLDEALKLCSRYSLAEVQANLSGLEKIRAGVLEGDVTTRIRFDIPFAIAVPDGEYSISLGRERPALLQLRYRPPGHQRFGFQPTGTGAGLPMSVDWARLQDTPSDLPSARVESLLSSRVQTGFNSLILDVPWLIDPFAEETQPPPLPGGHEERLNPLAMLRLPPEFHEAARITNLFIDHVRAASGRYEVDRISAADIQATSTSVWVRGHLMFRHDLKAGGPYRIRAGTPAQPDWIDRLTERLSGPPIDAVEGLILDAQKHIVQAEYRMAVLNVNAALELFVNTHVHVRLAGHASADIVQGFLQGPDVLERARQELLALASSGDRAAAIAADVLPTNSTAEPNRLRPSIYALVKFMDQYRPFGLSRTKLNRLINQIRVYRNEVAHGAVGNAELDPERVANAVERFIEFRDLAESTAV